jgi:site-specific DNA recombinase
MDVIDAVARAGSARDADCDAKLRQHRAALEAGADPTIVTGWMAETQARRSAAETRMRPGPQRQRLTREEIMRRLAAMRDVTSVLATAAPTEKTTIYGQLGLSLTYRPDGRRVDVKIRPMSGMYLESVRGPSRRLPTCPRSLASWALRGSSERVGRRPIRWTTTGCAAGVDRCDSPVPAMHMRI